MSTEGSHESLIRADRWSKVIALFFAMGLFALAAQLTDDALFNMTIAAFAGIGVRIYIPYHASISIAELDGKPIQEYEGTGNYHQGAVGGAVVIASLFALIITVLGLDSMPAMGSGAVAGGLSFLVLRTVLPS